MKLVAPLRRRAPPLRAKTVRTVWFLTMVVYRIQYQMARSPSSRPSVEVTSVGRR